MSLHSTNLRAVRLKCFPILSCTQWYFILMYVISRTLDIDHLVFLLYVLGNICPCPHTGRFTVYTQIYKWTIEQNERTYFSQLLFNRVHNPNPKPELVVANIDPKTVKIFSPVVKELSVTLCTCWSDQTLTSQPWLSLSFKGRLLAKSEATPSKPNLSQNGRKVNKTRDG